MSQFLKKLTKSRHGRNPSIQSCFPEINSAKANRSPKGYEIRVSMLGSCDGLCATGSTHLEECDPGISPPAASDPMLPLEISGSNIEVLRNSMADKEAEADRHVVLNPSMWQVTSSHPSIKSPIFESNLNKNEGDPFERFPVATVHLSPGSAETRGSDLRRYVVLYLAALKGDWETAKDFLNLNPQAVRARITRGSETALHIAAGARNTRFVEELVKLMTPDDLAMQNKVGNTALCFAVASGITKIAKAMVNKNSKLPLIRGSYGALPLYMAALLGHKDMVWYLYSITSKEDLTSEDQIGLLIAAITANLFDVVLDMIHHHPELAIARDANGDTALHVLARKPSAFYSGSQLGILQSCIYSMIPISNVLSWKILNFLGFRIIYEEKLMHIQVLDLVRQLWDQVLCLDDSKIAELIRSPSRLLFTAAELGIVELIIILIRSYPDLIWKVDDNSRSIFHIAVIHRQEKVFNLIHEIGALKDLIAAYKDENSNNMLHLAGNLAPANRLRIDSGAALQLRRELHWFKEVEKIVQPLYSETRDSKGRTPRVLFTDEHKSLVLEGEKWMKGTASSCMVVATLIATVMFAAAFTVPGGNNDHTGTPIYQSRRAFIVFAIADALALFSSTTSILIFLSILTSRYAEEDFLDSLPSRLIMGLATLFISISTMMLSFCATLFLVLGQGFKWIIIPIDLVAGIPVMLFALLQLPLFIDMLCHVYRSSTLFRSRSHLLY